jgi:restriction endonuclease Mrr
LAPLTQAKLLRLTYADLTGLVERLLVQMGCRDLRAAHPAGTPGPNPRGGYDLQARLDNGLMDTLVLTQVKQYSTPVPRCFVDELRGAMLRMGAGQGLIVTTSKFAPVAIEAAKRGNHQLPVRLIDGRELLALLRTYKIGVPHSRSAPEVPSTAGADMTLTLTLSQRRKRCKTRGERLRP